jgi:dTDP-4-amino-4,6-dideoxygalactose transaminase
MARIYLSPPDVAFGERDLLLNAFDSNWIAPTGPHVTAFEEELAAYVGARAAAALSSGTAALHLALIVLGVSAGDEVIVSDLTFVASANVVRYVGALPVFVDADPATWTLDPGLLKTALRDRVGRGTLPKAVIAVDLYGQCADYDALRAVCADYGIPIIQDASEALGACYKGRPAGTQGDIGVFSFNGNKIITTSAGGMLVSNRPEWVEEARYLSAQARDPVVHYEHSRVGYNYRMSNLLAALGRGQLQGLGSKVEMRRATFEFYRLELGKLPGWQFMPEAGYGVSSRWLTCATLDPTPTANRDAVCEALAREDIEARPVWKPMHLQPVYRDSPVYGGATAERLFRTGLCLPSGSSLTDADRHRVVSAAKAGWSA